MSPSGVARIAIDPLVCVGIGVCEEIAPGLVVRGDDEITRPVEGALLPREQAEDLCRRCPAGAISTVPVRTGQEA